MPFNGTAFATASLTNLDSRETLFFQFHPENLTERIDVDWSTQLPVGGSHEVATYNGTRSERIPLRLFYTTVGGFGRTGAARFTAGGQGLGQTDPSIPVNDPIRPPGLPNGSVTTRDFRQNQTQQTLDVVERFLKSLCYGDQLREQVHQSKVQRTTPPPRVMFVWPEVVKIEAHVESLSIRYDRFDAGDLRPLVLLAELTLREDLPLGFRIKGHEVRRNGTIRGRSIHVPSRYRAPRSEPRTIRTSTSFQRPPGGIGPVNI